MRLSLVLLAGFVMLFGFVGPVAAADGDAIEMSGEIDGRGLLLAECGDKPVHRIQLTVVVDKDGVGRGTLALDTTPREVDEFGLPKAVDARPPLKLELALKFVKKKTVQMRPAGPPEAEVEFWLYELKGPKITSNLTVAFEGRDWSYGRFMVAEKDGTGRIAVTLRRPEPPHTIPCHPGCFPAGTPIETPDGPKPVEAVRLGDTITTIGPDGAAGKGKVAAIFVTTNRLIDVHTEGGKTLVTTETQPLSLDGNGGGLRAAGQLKAGDRIQTWEGGGRRAAVVRSVAPAGREARVYNLVLGDPVLFVANGFLARSKPPAPGANDPVQP
jgi:hypothetical protein